MQLALKQGNTTLNSQSNTLVVSVVIPAFNEHSTVGSTIQDTFQVFRELGVPCEVIVVDDGSCDDTAVVAALNGAIVIRNKHRMGKGTALRRGFSRCRGDVIVTLDADCSHLPKQIPSLLAPILNEGVDVVFGFRVFNPKKPSASNLRFLGNIFFSHLVHLVTGSRITDSQCGFRAFRADIVRSMRLSSRRFEIESEMLIKVIRSGCRFVEVPITAKDALSSSKVNVIVDGLMILGRILLSGFAPCRK